MTTPRRSHRTKKSALTQNTGQLGVNFVEEIVLSMKFVWNPLHFESGIDGVIEVVETATGAATNRIIQAQVKATRGDFQSESSEFLSFSCEPEHIDYWLGGTAPVILVVCRPLTREAYWKDVKAYFNDPVNITTNTVRFDKKSDKFTPAVAPLLANLAQPNGGLHLGPLPKSEKLISNLFPLLAFPEILWSGASKCNGWETFQVALRNIQRERPWLKELIFTNNMIYSFLDLSQEPLSELIEPGTIETNSSKDWALTNNLDFKRNFSQLLNRCLRQFCFDQRIGYYSEKKLHYFMWENKELQRKIKCQSLEKAGKPSAAEWHPSKIQDGDGYFRHKAFHGDFMRFDGRWYLEVTPTYYFTSDGRTEHRISETLLSGIKRLDRHTAVRGNLLLWKSVFSEPDLTKRYKRLRFGPPLEFEIKTGIDDEAWKKTGIMEIITSEDDRSDRENEDDDGDSDQLALW